VFLTAIGTAYVTHGFDSYQLEAFKAAQFKQAAEDNAKALEQLEAAARRCCPGLVIEDMGKAVAARDAQSTNPTKGHQCDT
jgi:hypothetical protein